MSQRGHPRRPTPTTRPRLPASTMAGRVRRRTRRRAGLALTRLDLRWECLKITLLCRLKGVARHGPHRSKPFSAGDPSCSHVRSTNHPQSMNPPYEASPSLFSGNGGFQTPAPEPQDTEDAGLEITWSIELYANIYLAHVHKMYPFLREGSIRSWMRTCARGHTLDGDHKGFILRLLCAIGAFMCSSFADGCPHLKEATSLSQEAFGRFHAGAMRRGRAIRSQVCLLALFHAIYGPQPELIHEASASALAECAQILEWGSQKESRSKGSATMSDAQSAPGELEDEDDHDEHTSNIVLACHQVNEILACGWDRSAEDLPQLLDDKVRQHPLPLIRGTKRL